MKPNTSITLQLSEAEALVLFEWVSRFNDRDDDTYLEDPAERRVLWNLEAVLEPQLAAIVAPDYRDQLAEAREEVNAS